MNGALTLWDRLVQAKSQLPPMHSSYRVIYEDTLDLDEPVKVLIPDPHWMAAALHGGVLPPIESYWRDSLREDHEIKEHPYAEPIGPMTELEAIGYLIQKDIPPRVWMDGNRLRLRIVRASSVPIDRAYRNGWELAA